MTMTAEYMRELADNADDLNAAIDVMNREKLWPDPRGWLMGFDLDYLATRLREAADALEAKTKGSN